ncbi:GGDEF domain-containing response regulator [Edaphobacter dinghuensis]|uniref:diguanylate cyclase n=1 Tax=Edaphobacter dinghuensis TaxID=1560005 RepID=A0A917M0A0_9BACT|nr:diguanylate cyclase [Edaphobacter dinghuensis]GGG67459.1 diguanylate cyclase response regulator [Edaphobacter dinghuensis]
MKILLADDDPVSLRLMQRTLENYGYEVVTATDGLQAAQALTSPGGPRLALIDWMMPELDGPGVCREVRARHEDAYVYILLLTSRQSSEDVVVGLEAGADDYLTKPCHAAELKARLHTGHRVLQLEDKLVEAREEMRFKATHDALTSLWNRAGILTLLRSELSRSIRHQIPLSLLVCDIDHFKNINDTYGHPVGDEILQQVSSYLRHLVRPEDCVGRFGGEEFLIVLSGCDHASLEVRADEIREEISRVPFLTQEGAVSVSLSFGAITIEPPCEAVDLDLYVKKADAALYRAKAAGRNRVVFAESPVVVSQSEHLNLVQ